MNGTSSIGDRDRGPDGEGNRSTYIDEPFEPLSKLLSRLRGGFGYLEIVERSGGERGEDGSMGER